MKHAGPVFILISLTFRQKVISLYFSDHCFVFYSFGFHSLPVNKSSCLTYLLASRILTIQHTDFFHFPHYHLNQLHVHYWPKVCGQLTIILKSAHWKTFHSKTMDIYMYFIPNHPMPAPFFLFSSIALLCSSRPRKSSTKEWMHLFTKDLTKYKKGKQWPLLLLLAWWYVGRRTSTSQLDLLLLAYWLQQATR